MSTNLKCILFDTLFFLYSVVATAYLVYQAGHALAWIPKSLDEELFISEFHNLEIYLLAGLLFAYSFQALLHKLDLRTVGDIMFRNQTPHRQPHTNRFAASHLVYAFVATLLISLQVTESSITNLLDRDGLQGALRLWSGLTQPNLALLPRALAQAIETVYIAFLATVIAIPLAFILAFLCARNLASSPLQRALYFTIRAVLNISRSIEPLIWALIFTVWVGVGPFAGMLALMMHSVASLTKYYSEIIENVSQGPIDAVRCTGANSIQVLWYAVIPQIVLPYIAMTIYRWDTNVRMATVIGLVGGGGIGTLLIQYQGQGMWREVGCIVLVIASIVWLMDAASANIRDSLA